MARLCHTPAMEPKEDAERPTIERIDDGSVAVERCGDLFAADPIGCNMVATTVARGGPVEVIRVHDDERTLAAAVRWDDGYTLARLRPGASRAMADALPAGDGFTLFGGAGDVAEVAGRWTERTDGSVEPSELFRVYRLGDLRVPDVAGSAHVAGAEHVDTAADWAVAFGADTGLGAGADRPVAQMARAADEGRLRIWRVDGETVAHLLVSSPCFGAVRIGAVYTPDALRGRGYASALTAAVAAVERARPDVDEVLLNTQSSNALTNRLYRRLGFEAVYEVLIARLDTS